MEDRIPRITNDDIKRIIERDFPKNERDRVIKTLNRYKSESEKGANRVHAAILKTSDRVINTLNRFKSQSEHRPNRVYAAILKIADGSLEKVEKYVEVAIVDYRDVLSWAEYPSYSKNLFEEFSYEKEKQQNDDDWQQYNEWLNKPSTHL
jgi:hypothetical protein